MTKEEKKLLDRLSKGDFDGQVGDDFPTYKSISWMTIKEGNPIQYKRGPGGKFFNGKENERYEGKLHVLNEWKTDEEKLMFLQKYGWLMKDPEVKAYSAKYKPNKGGGR